MLGRSWVIIEVHAEPLESIRSHVTDSLLLFPHTETARILYFRAKVIGRGNNIADRLRVSVLWRLLAFLQL